MTRIAGKNPFGAVKYVIESVLDTVKLLKDAAEPMAMKLILYSEMETTAPVDGTEIDASRNVTQATNPERTS